MFGFVWHVEDITLDVDWWLVEHMVEDCGLMECFLSFPYIKQVEYELYKWCYQIVSF